MMIRLPLLLLALLPFAATAEAALVPLSSSTEITYDLNSRDEQPATVLKATTIPTKFDIEEESKVTSPASVGVHTTATHDDNSLHFYLRQYLHAPRPQAETPSARSSFITQFRIDTLTPFSWVTSVSSNAWFPSTATNEDYDSVQLMWDYQLKNLDLDLITASAGGAKGGGYFNGAGLLEPGLYELTAFVNGYFMPDMRRFGDGSVNVESTLTLGRVPEPSSCLLAMLGFAATPLLRKRRLSR